MYGLTGTVSFRRGLTRSIDKRGYGRNTAKAGETYPRSKFDTSNGIWLAQVRDSELYCKRFESSGRFDRGYISPVFEVEDAAVAVHLMKMNGIGQN